MRIRNFGAALLLVVGQWVCLVSAHADEVDTLASRVTELDARVSSLEVRLKPPAPPGADYAERRLIDAQVLFELKNYEGSAIILFDLVEKYPQSSAYAEAVFYLAEALYQKRDFLSARRYFERTLLQGETSKRYQQSLQRLIELSLHTGDFEPVDGYLAKLTRIGAASRTPSAPYVVGKYYFFRHMPDQALEYLNSIQLGHPYYWHALYFVGACHVTRGVDGYAKAEKAFVELARSTPQTDDQRLIAELAHLALGRLYTEINRLQESIDEYNKISTKSTNLVDALYESAWAYVKKKDYAQARRQLDLLLLNAPESSLAPEAKLLIGSLRIREKLYNEALDSFKKTRQEYEPLRQALTEELNRAGDLTVHFRGLVRKNFSTFEVRAVVPQIAQRWVEEQKSVQRLGLLLQDETDLNRSLDESDEIVARVERALTGPARVNVFPELASARTQAMEITHELTEIKTELSARETKLIAPIAGAEKPILDRLAQERADLETRLEQLPAKAANVEERQSKAKLALNEIDKEASLLSTELSGMKQSLQAVERLYTSQTKKVVPYHPAIPLKPPIDPTGGEAKDYNSLLGDLQGRLKKTREHLEAATKTLDQLKGKILQNANNVSGDLETQQKEIGAVSNELEELRRDLLLAATSIGVDDSDMQASNQLRAQFADVMRRQHAVVLEVRSRLSAADRTKSEQIESVSDRIKQVENHLANFHGKIDGLLDTKLKEINGILLAEKGRVGGYRTELSGHQERSAVVGGDVLVESVRLVSDRFYNISVRSDVGILDVGWALKDVSTKELNRILNERKRETKLLDDEFKEVLKEPQ